MASIRQNFISKLKSKAQNGMKKPTKKRKSCDIVKAVSPVPRELTDEELLLLDEIIEDSNDESGPPHKKLNTSMETNTYSKYQVKENVDSINHNSLLSLDISKQNQTEPKTEIVTTGSLFKSNSKPQSEQLSSLHELDFKETQTSADPSNFYGEMKGGQQSNSQEHTELRHSEPDFTGTKSSNKTQSKQQSPSQECHIEPDLTDIRTGSHPSELNAYNKSQNECQQQSLPQKNVKESIEPLTILNQIVPQVPQSGPSKSVNEKFSLQKQKEILCSKPSIEKQNNNSTLAKQLLPLQNASEKDSFGNVTYEDSLYDTALLHSVNPTLGIDSIPASPVILNNINKNTIYDSPDLSPYISEQILQLGGDMMDLPLSKTPIESPSLIASPLPYEEVQGDLRLANTNLQSTSPKQFTTKKRIVGNKKDKGRIRKVHKNEWKDIQRKHNKNLGKEYQSRDGKVRNAKRLGPSCKDNCKFKCSSKFNMDRRQNIFTELWRLGELVRHWDYINKYCKKLPKRRFTTETDSRRHYTIRYNLPNQDNTNQSTTMIKVCKTMFLNTLGIREGLVYSALNKLNAEGTVTKDKRGCHTNHKRVVTDEMTSSVCDHIKSFAPIESHYVRSQSKKVYLDGSLSVAKMFLLYLKWEDVENRDKVKTERQYRDIFNENFNIGFYVPKKDQCDICQGYKNSEKPVTKEEHEKYTEHMRNKTISRAMKTKDKENAKINKHDTITAVYDFQKVHGLPHGETSILYYKRKLTVFNFTVYDLGNSVGTCYVWDETTAKRGSIEVSSCIYDFIENYSQKGIKTFNFYSDNCGGQNRNRIVFAAYMRAAKDFKVTISHKYLEKGHTQNEGDSVHALIESSAKNKMVFIPDQWYTMIRWAKQDNNPYIVKEMDTTEFLDFKILLPNCNWTHDIKNETVYWSQIRQLEIFPEQCGKIFFKTDFCSHEFKCIIVDNAQDAKKKLRNRGKSKDAASIPIPIHYRRLQQAYKTKFPIPKAKHVDLKYLCEHKIIPHQYHRFYKNLAAGEIEIAEEEEV